MSKIMRNVTQIYSDQHDTSLYGWKISKTKPTYVPLLLETAVQMASLSESKCHKF